jgi:uncharacterized protein (DUF2062 family)
MLDLGQPLVVGLVLLASLLAVIGYFATHFAWRLYLVRAWRQRHAKRQPPLSGLSANDPLD